MNTGCEHVRLVAKRVILLLGALATLLSAGESADLSSGNLALAGRGALARSWEPGVASVPEHEPARANDGSLHSHWALRLEQLPADLGVEWPRPQKLSSLVVRLFRWQDGARTRRVSHPALGSNPVLGA